MADIRDVRFRARLPSFEMYLGDLIALGGATKALWVRSFQKGTFYVDVRGYTSPIELVIEVTNNKGEGRWANLDPDDNNCTISKEGNHGFTYVIEATWIRVRLVSGTATSIKPSAYISKEITG